jgi:hypothetical protein
MDGVNGKKAPSDGPRGLYDTELNCAQRLYRLLLGNAEIASRRVLQPPVRQEKNL